MDDLWPCARLEQSEGVKGHLQARYVAVALTACALRLHPWESSCLSSRRTGISDVSRDTTDRALLGCRCGSGFYVIDISCRPVPYGIDMAGSG